MQEILNNIEKNFHYTLYIWITHDNAIVELKTYNV